MSSDKPNALAESIGETASEVTLALLMIVHALKQQPGFDVNKFDSRIEQALRDSDLSGKPLLESILQGALTPKV